MGREAKFAYGWLAVIRLGVGLRASLHMRRAGRRRVVGALQAADDDLDDGFGPVLERRHARRHGADRGLRGRARLTADVSDDEAAVFQALILAVLDLENRSDVLAGVQLEAAPRFR